MKKLYLLESDDELIRYYIDYNESKLSGYVFSKDDNLELLDSIVTMTNYYQNSILLDNPINYVQSSSNGERVLLGQNAIYMETEHGDYISKVLSSIKYEKGKVISLKDIRQRVEQNIVAGYDFYKNQHLKYGLKDYQDIILAHVNMAFDEYKEEALQNTKVLAKAFIKRGKHI